MQYTASSFAAILVSLFRAVFLLKSHRPTLNTPFPDKSHFESHVADLTLEGFLLPWSERLNRWLLPLRFLQQGRIQLYLLYIFIILVVLMLWGEFGI
jgi:hydrogenase-4 component B